MLRTTRNRRGLSTLHIVLIIVGAVLILMVTCAGLLAAVMLPALGKARDAAQSMKSQAQLQGMESVREIYAQQHQGSEDPPMLTLQMLIDEQYMTYELTLSPHGPVSDGRGDYWFNPVLFHDPADSEFRIASYDRAMYENHYRQVAYCLYGGECEVVDVEEFQRLMQLPENAGIDFDLPVRRN